MMKKQRGDSMLGEEGGLLPTSRLTVVLLLFVITSVEVHGKQPLDLIEKGQTFTAKTLDGGEQNYTIQNVQRNDCKNEGMCNEITFSAMGQDRKEYYVKFPTPIPFEIGMRARYTSKQDATPEQKKIVLGGVSADDWVQREVKNMRAVTKAWQESDGDKYKPQIPLLVDTEFTLQHTQVTQGGVDRTSTTFVDAIMMTKVEGDHWKQHMHDDSSAQNIREDVLKTIKWFAERGFMDLDWQPNTLYDAKKERIARIDFGIMTVYEEDKHNWDDVCAYVEAVYETIEYAGPVINSDPTLLLKRDTPASERTQAMARVMQTNWKHRMDVYIEDNPSVHYPYVLRDLNDPNYRWKEYGLWIGLSFSFLFALAVIICLCQAHSNKTEEDPLDLENPELTV